MSYLALLLWKQRRHDSSVAMYRQLLSIEKRLVGADSVNVAQHMCNLGGVLFDMQKYEDALIELNQSHAILLVMTKGRGELFNLVVDLQNKCTAAIVERDTLAKKE